MDEISRDILLRSKRGDTEAFRLIFRQYRSFVLSVIYRFLAGKHPEQHEGMVRDIFINIFNILKTYDPDKGVKFSSVVFTCVRNYCFNELRKKRLEAENSGEYNKEPEQVDDIENGALAGELKQRLEKCIESLTDEQRTMLILKEYEGFSYEESGQLLNLTAAEVKLDFNKAKVKLKDLLWPYLKEDHGKTL